MAIRHGTIRIIAVAAVLMAAEAPVAARAEPASGASPGAPRVARAAGGVAASAPASREAPVQMARPGDTVLEMGRPLRLVLNAANPEPLWRAGRTLSRALAPVSSTVPTTGVTGPPPVLLHWADPARPAVYRIREGGFDVPIPSGPPRVAEYHLTWQTPGGELEVRVPAPPRRFKAHLEVRQRSVVLDGTGSVEEPAVATSVVVHLRIRDPAGVERASLLGRWKPEEEFRPHPMALASGDPQEGRWEARVLRPPELPARLEYRVEIVNRRGETSHYGRPGLPHVIRVVPAQ
jgi:hypothetical protein